MIAYVHHFLDLIRAHVGAVRKAKVDDVPLAEILGRRNELSVVVHELPGTANFRLADCTLSLNLYL